MDKGKALAYLLTEAGLYGVNAEEVFRLYNRNPDFSFTQIAKYVADRSDDNRHLDEMVESWTQHLAPWFDQVDINRELTYDPQEHEAIKAELERIGHVTAYQDVLEPLAKAYAETLPEELKFLWKIGLGESADSFYHRFGPK